MEYEEVLSTKQSGVIEPLIRQPIQNPLTFDKGWDPALSNMGETFRYITESSNITAGEVRWYEVWNGRCWVRVGMVVGASLVSLAGLAVSSPFYLVGGITFGVSKMFKGLADGCFDKISFDGFWPSFFSLFFLAPLGGVAWVIGKISKYISKACFIVAKAPIHAANYINLAMVRNAENSAAKNNSRKNNSRKIEKNREKSKNRKKILNKTPNNDNNKKKGTKEQLNKKKEVEEANKEKQKVDTTYSMTVANIGTPINLNKQYDKKKIQNELQNELDQVNKIIMQYGQTFGNKQNNIDDKNINYDEIKPSDSAPKLGTKNLLIAYNESQKILAALATKQKELTAKLASYSQQNNQMLKKHIVKSSIDSKQSLDSLIRK